MRKLLFSLAAVSALAGCSSLSHQPVTSFYDYQLATPQGKALSVAQLDHTLLEADVILIGEWHTHAGIHRFQTDLLQSFIQSGHPVTLSMEQFSRESQSLVDQYLAGDIGEQPLISQGKAWPNYESDYRPLVELAKANDVDIIAANAPKPIVRCIGRQGLDYVEKLDENERVLLAQSIDTSASPYKEKFMASMHHGKPEQTEKQFAAQVTWDETMAESIVQYLAQHPDKQVIHVAGKFHTEGGLGTKRSILQRNPDLKVVVVTPVGEVVSDSTDYQLHVIEPPTRFIQQENRMKAYKKLSKRNDDLLCK
ncbi:ChaN family lipoprotein [Vibrio paucivorans]|uniref:ChaN family lipoprotein n=1 Tax=Vibrio paucivorans TaxID=2829489 RepID=A0A9X3HT54_9VIBR|nr:ChaN family lipoprotein [Vibrio paucivorans]MCW8335379.1 ChaN family lipoprotein [Vibrio paucivorans]